MSGIVRIGTRVLLGGCVHVVQGVGNGGAFGERYYFLTDGGGVVSMMPADVVESAQAPVDPPEGRG